MTTTETADAIARAVLDTKGFMHGQADAVARDYQLGNAEALRLLWKGLEAQFLEGTPMERDSRAAYWRCRFRLYRQDQPDEPQADSDPERAADLPGTQIIRGLPAVATELLTLASAFHGTGLLQGLTGEVLRHSLRGLRPTLSRNRGRAAWRLPYDTFETFTDGAKKRGWIARVDIVREAQNP